MVVRKRPHDNTRKHIENLTSLSEVKSSTPKLSTAAEAAMSRRGMGVVSCLGSSELAHRQHYEAKKCTDITVPVRERHTQVVSSCKAQEEIHVDQEVVSVRSTPYPHSQVTDRSLFDEHERCGMRR